MLEARRAFLVDTLQKLLGQDSPTGYTEKVVTVAEGIARELGFATPAHQQGQSGDHGARPGERPQGRTLCSRGYPGPDGTLHHRRRHADGHHGRRPRCCPPWTVNIAASTPGKARCTPVRCSACPRRSMCRMTRPPAPGTRKTWLCASTRRCTARRTCRPWALLPGGLCLLRHQDHRHRKRLCEVPLPGR